MITAAIGILMIVLLLVKIALAFIPFSGHGGVDHAILVAVAICVGYLAWKEYGRRNSN